MGTEIKDPESRMRRWVYRPLVCTITAIYNNYCNHSSNSNPVSYWVTGQTNKELYTRTGQTVFLNFILWTFMECLHFPTWRLKMLCKVGKILFFKTKHY